MGYRAGATTEVDARREVADAAFGDLSESIGQVLAQLGRAKAEIAAQEDEIERLERELALAVSTIDSLRKRA